MTDREALVAMLGRVGVTMASVGTCDLEISSGEARCSFIFTRDGSLSLVMLAKMDDSLRMAVDQPGLCPRK